MIPLPRESALRERVTALNTALEPYIITVAALKRKMIQRLLAWDHDIHGVKIDGVGTFVREGVREILEGVLEMDAEDTVDLDRFGGVTLSDEHQDQMNIASLYVPSDKWSSQHWINKNFLLDVDRMTFVPEYCDGVIDPLLATLDSNGPFQLNDNDERMAKLVMSTDYVRAYAGIAKTIHTEEEPDVYRSTRVDANIEYAFRVMDWLEREVGESKNLL